MREFCEFRNLLPRGVNNPDDIWDRCAYILSTKMQDPQFAGQTKGVSSRQAAAFVSGVVKDAFGLWLNQHTDVTELLAEMCISNAQRLRQSKKVARKKVTQGPALPGNSLIVHRKTTTVLNYFWSRVTLLVGQQSRLETESFKQLCRCE